MRMDAKGIIILLVTITALTSLIGYWNFVQIDRSIPKLDVTHVAKSQGLGSTIYVEYSNPVANQVPESNPFVHAVASPFDVYTNPFGEE